MLSSRRHRSDARGGTLELYFLAERRIFMPHIFLSKDTCGGLGMTVNFNPDRNWLSLQRGRQKDVRQKDYTDCFRGQGTSAI